MNNIENKKNIIHNKYHINHGEGLIIKTAHPAIQVPNAILQPIITIGSPAPAVTDPNLDPAAL
jgi:hypothetical protein